MYIANKILETFKKHFNQNPVIVQSPGRINLIGEHTDYNMGLVFPATIDKYIFVAIAKSNDNISTIYSVDLNEILQIDLNKLEKQEKGSWKNYVIGVISELINKGKTPENFNLVFGGNIPIGAGMSSSAALENGIVFGLNKLFDLKLETREMIDISIAAEHNFADVNCGIMDQFSNLNGKKDNAILLDCSDLSFNHIPIKFDEFQLLLINTNVKHQLSDSPYNQRKESCRKGYEILNKKYPGLTSLSDANISQLNSVKTEMPHKIYNRCKYVIEENDRVKQSVVAIKNKDWNKLGNLLFASHEGLSKLYEVSCEELDFLVEIAQKDDSVSGSRMMGGGFGGCTINLVKKNAIDQFRSKAEISYYNKFGIKPDTYLVNITDGTKIIEI